ncbi:MAG: response regulator [Comamonadaceae bacterium]|nr:MAG: response regulator [Comamonadaceae bacterium]
MKFRAYIVEDSPTIRENLFATLTELALVEPVGIAETESEGKEWLAANSDYWDLAIVDLFLKEGSGLNILEALKYRQPQQKMVVLSNHATDDIRWRCAQLGADAVFDKSMEIDALVEFCVKERNKFETVSEAAALQPLQTH